MSFAWKLSILCGGMLAVSLVCAALAFFGVRWSQFALERVALADAVLAEYLEVDAETQRLLRLYSDGAEDDLIAAAERSLEVHFDEVQRLIVAEVELVGEEEIEELALLARIQRGFRALRARWAAMSPEERLAIARDGADETFTAFTTMLEEALEEEREEVVETKEEVTAVARLMQGATLGAGILVCISVIGGLVILLRALVSPLSELARGADLVSRGDFDHRIPLAGSQDLAAVGHAFNRMADAIAQRERSLQEARTGLEAEVARRTIELKAVLERLQEAETNRKRLMADVSHELRTPLTIIRGEADIALRSGVEGPAREALERSRAAADHTARIVDDLLFVARQEEGEPRLRLETVDLGALLSESLVNFARLAGGTAQVDAHLGAFARRADDGDRAA
ncbi:MAG: histidine kinase dimerization/phospho-acceptor domain-containing protein, partial [Pseudomonadota bacterium]